MYPNNNCLGARGHDILLRQTLVVSKGGGNAYPGGQSKNYREMPMGVSQLVTTPLYEVSDFYDVHSSAFKSLKAFKPSVVAYLRLLQVHEDQQNYTVGVGQTSI